MQAIGHTPISWNWEAKESEKGYQLHLKALIPRRRYVTYIENTRSSAHDVRHYQTNFLFVIQDEAANL